MHSVLSKDAAYSEQVFSFKSLLLSYRFPLCLALATIRAHLSGDDGGLREWEAEADRSFPALGEAVGLLPAEKRAAGFGHIPAELWLQGLA